MRIYALSRGVYDRLELNTGMQCERKRAEFDFVNNLKCSEFSLWNFIIVFSWIRLMGILS